MRHLIGCEVGNYDIKLMNMSKETISVINVISPGRNRRTLGDSKKSLINLLDVTIDTKSIPKERWFAGGLAFTDGEKKFKPTRENKKSENPLTIIQQLTTVAYSLFDINNPVKEVNIKLGTCLPTEEYFDEDTDFISILTNKLKGYSHTIEFNDPAFKGNNKEAKIILNIEEVSILPEGSAGQIATTYDWNGKPIIDDLEYKTIMNLDIGSIDTDVSILENGDFLSKGFFGIKGGTTAVLRKIADEIKDEYGGNKLDTHLIDYHIRSKTPIRVGNEIVSLENLLKMTERHYEMEAWSLVNELQEEFKDRGIDKAGINLTNLIGGGPQFFETGFKKHFSTSKNIEVKIPNNPRYAVVEGALKSIVFEEQGADPEGAEVFTD